MTPAQREHAAAHWRLSKGSLKIIEARAMVSRHVQLGDDGERLSAPELIGRMACASDAVVQGQVRGVESFPLQSGSFLFSDLTFHVSSVLRGNVAEGADILVTRPGGELSIDGTFASATINTAPLLRPNRVYVLFLKALPTGDAYLSNEFLPTFEVDSRAKELSGRFAAAGERLSTDRIPTGYLRQIVQGAPCR